MLNQEVTLEIEQVEAILSPNREGTDYVLQLGNKDKKKYVLSKYNPVREAQSLAQSCLKNKEMVCVIFGLECGYLLQAVEELTENKSVIIVIEPNQSLVEELFKLKDFETFLGRPNVILQIGMEEESLIATLMQNIGLIDIHNTVLLASKEYQEFYPKAYQKAEMLVQEILGSLQVTQNTINHFASLHIKNALQNAHYVDEAYDITKHFGNYTGVPALIVSGGPSLNKNIALAKDFKGIIFAMGRTLPILLKEGIRPDFLVAIDPQEVSLEAYENCLAHDIPMISSLFTAPQALMQHQGKKYFILPHTATAIDKVLLGRTLPRIDVGGTVANAICSIAYEMGCNPLVFIGQDLAYTNGQKHYTHKESTEKDIEEDAQLIEVEGYYDDKVLTPPNLLGYLRWFEQFKLQHEDRNYINATEGGAKINGFEQTPFSEFLQNLNQGTYTKNLIKEEVSLAVQTSTMAQRLALYQEALKALRKTVATGQNTCLKLQVCYQKNNGIQTKEAATLLKQIQTFLTKGMEQLSQLALDELARKYLGEVDQALAYKEPLAKQTALEQGIVLTKNLQASFEAIEKTITEIESSLG